MITPIEQPRDWEIRRNKSKRQYCIDTAIKWVGVALVLLTLFLVYHWR